MHCEQNTHSYSMYRCAQCVSTSHCTVRSLFIMRTRVAQEFDGSSLGVPKTFCHPRVMSRSLPHLTLTTSTNSLSPASPILQSTHKLVDARCKNTLRRFTADPRKSHLPQVMSPKMIELGALLDKNLEVQHQDLTQD